MNRKNQGFSPTVDNSNYMLHTNVSFENQNQCPNTRSILMPKSVPRYSNHTLASNQHQYVVNNQQQNVSFQANPNRDQNLLMSASQSCMYGGKNAFFNDTFSVMQLPVQNHCNIENERNYSTNLMQQQYKSNYFSNNSEYHGEHSNTIGQNHLQTSSTNVQVDNSAPEVPNVNDSILYSTRSLSIETNNSSDLRIQSNLNKRPKISEEDNNNQSIQKDIDNFYFLTGTVEKVINWNKLLIENRIIFEVIAKCLAIHEGITPIAKELLIRNEKGPVLQVFYYEVDFSLNSEITSGVHVRCVGHMIGSNKLIAYTVQPATLHEMTTLQRFTFISDNVVKKISNTSHMK